MDSYRFFIPNLRQAGRRVTLPDDEVHHAGRVLRLSAGDPVIVFDGQGASAQGKFTGSRGAGGGAVELLGESLQVEDEPALRLTLATAVPKGPRADVLVEQASQLGVWRLRWLTCDRGIVRPRDDGGKIDKWRRMAIESAKQCGRTHLMLVQEMAGLADVLSGSWRKVVWLEPRADTAVQAALQGLTSGDVLAIIGPEGGWTPRERATLAATGEPVHLTPTVLRIETACAAIATLITLQSAPAS